MFADFELLFEYRHSQVCFTLLQHGITKASQRCLWSEVESALSGAIAGTVALDRDETSAEQVLELWTGLIAQVVGRDACEVIVAAVPARLTIVLDVTVPVSHHELFRIAPFDIAIAEIGGVGDDQQDRPVLQDEQITLIDVRVEQEKDRLATSFAGVEQVPISMDYHSEKEDDDATGTSFPVWFGTNRKLFEKDGQIFEVPEGIDEDTVHFGKSTVWIPKSHRRGELKSPLYDPRRWFVDDALQFESIQLTEDISSSIKSEIKESDETNHLLFIHGFNSSFSDAILRAAQIGFDLGIDGATMAFSWPSRKLLPFITRYVGDGEIISGSEAALRTMIEQVSTLNGKLHIIAHSMGNRALTGTWEKLFKLIAESESLRVGQVVFAAPDVVQYAFRSKTESIHDFCERATVYANRHDYALGLSRFLSRTPRAGVLPPVMHLDKIDLIEVPFNLALFGHTYFAKLIPMLEDLAALIESNIDPGEGRRQLVRPVTGDVAYWQLSSHDEPEPVED